MLPTLCSVAGRLASSSDPRVTMVSVRSKVTKSKRSACTNTFVVKSPPPPAMAYGAL